MPAAVGRTGKTRQSAQWGARHRRGDDDALAEAGGLGTVAQGRGQWQKVPNRVIFM